MGLRVPELSSREPRLLALPGVVDLTDLEALLGVFSLLKVSTMDCCTHSLCRVRACLPLFTLEEAVKKTSRSACVDIGLDCGFALRGVLLGFLRLPLAVLTMGVYCDLADCMQSSF